jgi:hypothetical protein
MESNLIPLFSKVIFSQIFSTEEPLVGWVISNTFQKWREHPYLITVDEELLNECMQNETLRNGISDYTDSVYRGHEKLVAIFTENLYKRIVKHHSKYNKSKFLKKNLNISYYNKLILNGKKIGIYSFIILYKVQNFVTKLFNFIFRVLILGTVWIVFGNVIQIYQGQYKKYIIKKKISEVKKNPLNRNYYNSGVDQESVNSELESLENDYKDANEQIDKSSNAFLATIIALIGLFISIYSLINVLTKT